MGRPLLFGLHDLAASNPTSAIRATSPTRTRRWPSAGPRRAGRPPRSPKPTILGMVDFVRHDPLAYRGSVVPTLSESEMGKPISIERTRRRKWAHVMTTLEFSIVLSIFAVLTLGLGVLPFAFRTSE